MITTPCVQGGFIGQSAENFIPSVLSDTTGVWFDPSDIRLNWRKNFARYSEDITNAAWVKTGTTASASNLFVETAVTGEHYIAQTVTMGGICTFTFEVKDSSTGRSIIRAATGTTSATYGVVFDLNSNTFSTIGTAIISCTSTVLADGYTRISITSNAGVNQIRVQTISSGTTFYLGDVTKGLYVRNLQVEYGSTFTGYQKITDGLADYSTYTGITIPTMYQDSVGSIIASQVEQPVGLILDKSKRLVLGSELVTNGDFSSGNTGWIADASVSFTGGAAVFTAAVGGAGIAQTLSVPVGSFICSFTVSNASSGGLTFRIRTAGGTIYATFTTENNTALNKTYSFIFSPASVSNRLEIISPGGAGSPTTLTLDNISIKPLAGNHAYQTSTNSRPYLRARQNRLTYSEQFENAAWVKDNSSIQSNLITYSQDFSNSIWTKTNSFVQTNLITYSQQFDNAAWTKSNTAIQTNLLTYSQDFANTAWTASNTSVSTVTSPLAPDGTATVTRITPANGATSGINQTKESAGTKTLSVRAKFDTAQYLSLGFSNGAGYVTFAVFNLQTGSFVTSNMHPAVGTSLTTAITNLGNGWYLYSITLNGNTSVTPVNHIAVGTAYTPSGYAYALTGDGISSSYVWGAQLVQGAVPGDYRATTTAALPVLYTAPDSTTSAQKLCVSSTTSTHYTSYALSSILTSTNYTTSVYVKAGEYSWAIVYIGSIGIGKYINLLTGEVGSNFIGAPVSTTVTNAGNGWWRVALSGNSGTNTIADIRVYAATADNTSSYLGDGSSGIYVWGAQLVQGAVPGDYRATTTAALPVLYTAPDGTLTANKIVPTSTNAGYPWEFVTFSSGTIYTISWYIKSAELTSVMVGIGNAFGDTNMIVDLSTGTVTTPPVSAVSYFATSVGNGWWRIGFTKASATTGAGGCYCFPRGTANSSDGIYSWGAQVVQGSSAGNYQATISSSLPVQYIAPDGTLTAESILAAAGNTFYRIYQSQAVSTVQNEFTASVYLKKNTWQYATVVLGTDLTSGAVACTINLDTGQITKTGVGDATPFTPTLTSATSQSVGNGWYRVIITGIPKPNTTARYLLINLASSANPTYDVTSFCREVWVASGTESIYVWGADLRTGNNAGKYQRTAATAWSTVGTLDYDVIGQQPYLWFDGVDDNLLTNTIDFTATDKMIVCAGVTKLSDAAVGIIAELSTSAGTGPNPGTFVLHAQTSPVGYRYAAGSGASGAAFATDDASTFTSPITNVVTGISNFAGATINDELSMQVNGAVPTQLIAGTTSTGNFGSYPIYIGRRGAGSLPFTGQLYNLVIAGKAVTSSQLTTIEKYVASKTNIVI